MRGRKEQGQEMLKIFFKYKNRATVSSWLFCIPGPNPPFCLLDTFSMLGSFCTLKVVEAGSFKVFVLIFQAVWCHIPQNYNLNTLC
jgi:hypothetical protein